MKSMVQRLFMWLLNCIAVWKRREPWCFCQASEEGSHREEGGYSCCCGMFVDI